MHTQHTKGAAPVHRIAALSCSRTLKCSGFGKLSSTEAVVIEKIYIVCNVRNFNYAECTQQVMHVQNIFTISSQYDVITARNWPLS